MLKPIHNEAPISRERGRIRIDLDYVNYKNNR